MALTQAQLDSISAQVAAISKQTQAIAAQVPAAVAAQSSGTSSGGSSSGGSSGGGGGSSYSAPAPAPTSSGGGGGGTSSSSTTAAQAAAIQAQISDLQAQQKALSTYNLTDTNQLTKNSSGQYVPKTTTVTTTPAATPAANVPVTSGTSASATTNAQIAAVQKQLADLQAQSAALKQYNLSDTNQLIKDASGNYVPSEEAILEQNNLQSTLKNLADTYAASQKEQATILQNIKDKTARETMAAIKQMQESANQSLQAYITEQNTYLDQIKNQPSAVSALQKFREEQGLPQMEQQLIAVDQSILTTENLLNNVESDIRKRTEGLPVSEAAARRLVAMEQAPLSKQLSEQLTARQKLAAGLEAKQATVQEFVNAQKEDIAKQTAIINTMMGVSEQKYEAATSLAEKMFNIVTELNDKLTSVDLKQLELVSSAAEYKTKLIELGFTAYQQAKAAQAAQAAKGEEFQNELIKLKLESELNRAEAGYDNVVKQAEDGTYISISTSKDTGKSIVTNLGVVGKTSSYTDEQDIVNKFNNDLANNKLYDNENEANGQYGTREAFIKYLQLKYQDIEPQDIADAVYAAYPNK